MTRRVTVVDDDPRRHGPVWIRHPDGFMVEEYHVPPGYIEAWNYVSVPISGRLIPARGTP